MSDPGQSRVHRLSRLWQHLKDGLIQEVPEDIACCEFDCRKGQCTQDEWESCPRRLSYLERGCDVRPGHADSPDEPPPRGVA
jgi:hypothetical protein